MRPSLHLAFLQVTVQETVQEIMQETVHVQPLAQALPGFVVEFDLQLQGFWP